MFLIALATFLTCLYFYLYKSSRFSRVKDVPLLPNSVPILGHSLQFPKNMFPFLVELGNQSQKMAALLQSYLGRCQLISDPVDATTVLSTCLEKSFMYRLINPLYGDVLIAAPGSVWKRNRKIIDVAFKAQVLESYMDVFNNQASVLLDTIDLKAAEEYVDMSDDITRNVLETACQTTMGYLPENQNYVDEKFVEAKDKVFEITTQRVQKIWMFLDFVFHFTKAKIDLDEALAVISDTSAKMVALRKSEYIDRIQRKSDKEITTNGKLASFLDIVIECSSTDKSCLFTDSELRYLCDNMLLSAFDITTYELMFTMVCIGSNETVQRKIYQEIQDVMGDEEIVRKEHLHKLVYLEAVYKEALRLYPIGPVVARQASEPVKLGNVTLPAGSEIVVHIWAINRDKKLWGADADEFKPDRWLNPSTLPPHPNSFGTFSFGRRNCIGKTYAMMHMKATLVPILRKYRIIADHNKMEFECFILLKAIAGHFMKFELR